MRKVEVGNLPLTPKGKIDWENSVGQSVSFVYDDVIGEIAIVGYEGSSYILVEYLDNKTFRIYSGSLKNCNIGALLKKNTGEFKVKLGTVYKDNKRNLTIIAQEKRGRYKHYEYKCNKCGCHNWIEESNLLKGVGCPCRTGKIVVKGINDIATTNPELLAYIVDKNDAYTHTYSSTKKLACKCPSCEYERTMSPNQLYAHGFACPRCSDGVSYPEKFINELLAQVSDNYIYQLTKTELEWCDKYRYDFAILDSSCIIEVHGISHYTTNNFSSLGGKTLEQEQENDLNKESLAKLNGIENYIVIDARYSKLDWIKNSVMNSSLPQLLSFQERDVDWLRCHESGLHSLIKVACNYKRLEPEISTTEIAERMGLSTNCIRRYLRQGVILGWCDYDPVKEREKGLALGRGSHKSTHGNYT